MRATIKRKLEQIEKDKNVKILYACEAGSRAWGFASRDSDFDIRYIYLNHPNWYLSIAKDPRDVIEIMDKENDLDFVGWDLRKTLRLLKKSNPQLLEWAGSDITYIRDEAFYLEFQELVDKYYSPIPLLYHYLHMAKGNIREYLKGENEVWLKKYLYVIRPLLACNWIERKGSIPPVSFEMLLHPFRKLPGCGWPGSLLSDIDNLVLRKKAGDELSFGPIIPSIHSFIETEVERLSDRNTQEEWRGICEQNSKDIDALNLFFRSTLDHHFKCF